MNLSVDIFDGRRKDVFELQDPVNAEVLAASLDADSQKKKRARGNARKTRARPSLMRYTYRRSPMPVGAGFNGFQVLKEWN